MTVALSRTGEDQRGLARRVLEGQDYLRGASTPVGLRELARRVVDVAGRAGCPDLIAASRHGDAPLAAAVLLFGDHLQITSARDVRDGTVDKVLVIEPVVISGLHVRRQVMAMREAGATWVGVAILHDLGEDADATRHQERLGFPDASYRSGP